MHASCAAFQGFNDLRVYDPAAKSWTGDISYLLSGTLPDIRYFHCLTSADGLLFVHGGIGGNGKDNQKRAVDIVKTAPFSGAVYRKMHAV